MTPLEIDIILWYHTRAVDYRDGDLSAPAVREAVDRFRDVDGLLELRPPTGSGDFRTYRLTERGQAYVDALIMTPLPICQWVIPCPAQWIPRRPVNEPAA